MKFRLFVVTLLLTACTHQSSVPVSPAFDVYSSYEGEIPGNWYLWVDSSELRVADLRFPGLNCAAYNYPLDVSETFTQSSLRTIENIVEDVTLVDSPITREKIRETNHAGLIIMRGEDIEADLVLHPGFWSSKPEADVEITLTVLVDGRQGRLLGTTVSDDADVMGSLGGFCEGAATVLGEAASEAVRKVLQRAAERIGNEPRIRTLGGEGLSGQ